MEFHLGILLDYSKKKNRMMPTEKRTSWNTTRSFGINNQEHATGVSIDSIRSIDWTVRLPFAPFHTGDVGIVVFFPVVVVRLFIYTDL